MKTAERYLHVACEKDINLSVNFLSVIVFNFIEQVNVAISTRDNYCIEVVLRCLAVEGDGLGLHQSNDGGILSTVMAAGFKGKKQYYIYFWINLCGFQLCMKKRKVK